MINQMVEEAEDRLRRFINLWTELAHIATRTDFQLARERLGVTK